jgi:hypothetical protein
MGPSVWLLPALRMCKKQAYEHDVCTHHQKDLGGNYARMRGANAALGHHAVGHSSSAGRQVAGMAAPAATSLEGTIRQPPTPACRFWLCAALKEPGF